MLWFQLQFDNTHTLGFESSTLMRNLSPLLQHKLEIVFLGSIVTIILSLTTILTIVTTAIIIFTSSSPPSPPPSSPPPTPPSRRRYLHWTGSLLGKYQRPQVSCMLEHVVLSSLYTAEHLERVYTECCVFKFVELVHGGTP